MTNFNYIYSNNIEPYLQRMRRRKPWVVIAGIFSRFFELYFITVVISLFIGFLVNFGSGEMDNSGFATGVIYFMYGVLGIVVLSIVNKQVRVKLGAKNPELLRNNWLVNGITLMISAVVLACGYFIGTMYLGGDFDFPFFIKWGLGIASIFVMIFPYSLLKKIEFNFVDEYKKVFFSAAIPTVATDVSYDANNYIQQDEFTASKLFTFQEIWSYDGSDLFQRHNHNLHGSRLKVQQREVHQSSGKTETKITQLFNGYFFVTDMNKQFYGETYIFPDIMRNLMGEVYAEFLNQYVHRPKLQIVKLEDPEFERSFAVYSSDPVEARYILSPKMVEQINSFKKIFYQDISISFVGQKLFLAIHSDSEIFSPSIFSAGDDRALAEKQLNYLQVMLKIPEELLG